MEYLIRLRVERAKTLLRETDLKVIDIAIECGFGSSQYFANTFKKATELTPTVYRTQCNQLSNADTRNWKNIPFRSEDEELQRIRAFAED